MKTKFKHHWVIVDKKDNVYPLSIQHTKKDCIEKFPIHMLPGYRCVKVLIEFTEVTGYLSKVKK